MINEIMSGETTQVQTAAFLSALSTKSTKSETIAEIASLIIVGSFRTIGATAACYFVAMAKKFSIIARPSGVRIDSG